MTGQEIQTRMSHAGELENVWSVVWQVVLKCI